MKDRRRECFLCKHTARNKINLDKIMVDFDQLWEKNKPRWRGLIKAALNPNPKEKLDDFYRKTVWEIKGLLNIEAIRPILRALQYQTGIAGAPPIPQHETASPALWVPY